MGTPAPHEMKRNEHADQPAVTRRSKDVQDRIPTSHHAVDTMLDSIGGDAMRAPNAIGPATPAAHAEGLKQQFSLIQQAVFEVVSAGVAAAMRDIEAPELANEPTSAIGEMLALAASIALAGSAGSIAVWVGRAIASRIAQKFVEDAIKDVVKRAFKSGPGPSPRNLIDLKTAFINQLDVEQTSLRIRFARAWADTSDRLSVLPAQDLEAINEHASTAMAADTSSIITDVSNQTVIAWTNFLAQAKHGRMAGWDFWERNGGKHAIALRGAAPAPTQVSEDPTRSNVNPDAMGPALDNQQRPMQGEHFGILEVFVDTLGDLVAVPGYGMRLDHVGPTVRARLAQLGRVRDLPVNKVIRVCSMRLDPPVPLASILVTADGYARSANWLRDQTMTFRSREPMGVGRVLEQHRCMDELIHGRETGDCHLNPEIDAKAIAAVAERAQALSLNLLEA